MWHNIWLWIQANPGTAITWAVAITSFVTGGIQFLFSVLVGALEAPTAQSSSKYRYWFKVANTIVGNLKRANPPRVEDSPNFEAALNKAIQAIGEAKGAQKTPAVILDTNVGKNNPPH